MDLYNFNEDPDLEFELPNAGPTRPNTPNGDLFLEAIHSCNTPVELKALFDDFLTDNEWRELTRRMFAAWLLFTGMPYEGVKAMTGMGNNGVARLSKKMISRTYGLSATLSKVRRHRRFTRSPSPETQ